MVAVDRARRSRIVAGVLAVGLLLTACTTPQVSRDVATIQARLPSADPLAQPGQLSFRMKGLIGVDGLDRPLPSGELDPAGDGRAACEPGSAIAVLLPLSGQAAPMGVPIRDAVTGAVAAFTQANPGCRLQVKEFDSQTSDAGSVTAAKAVVADGSIIGVIGPVFSHEVDLIGDRFTEAGLALVSPSSTVPDLAGRDSGFFRGLPNERQSAEAGANYLTKRLGLARLCVVEQGYPETEYAAEMVRGAVGVGAVACSLKIGNGLRSDYRAEVDLVVEAGADAVYFAGYAAPGAAVVRELHQVAPDVIFMGWEGVLDGDEFVRTAADHGRGTLAVGPFLPTAALVQDPAASSSVDGSSRFATEARD